MKSAYRQLSVREEDQFVMVVARNPHDGKLYGARARCLLFGESAAVLDFNTYARVQEAIAKRTLKAAVTSKFLLRL